VTLEDPHCVEYVKFLHQVRTVLSCDSGAAIGSYDEVLNQPQLFVCMFEATKVNLVVCDELLPEINCKINSIGSLIDFFLEYMIETGLWFTLHLDLFLKLLH
jgi:hypothetical protein